MAAIEIPGNGRSAGHSRVRSTRLSTRVDMTPMVDLGFLLITFFMLTTTLSNPTAMSVFFPKKDAVVGSMPIKASNVLTIFLGDNDAIYYLDGLAATDDNAESALKTTISGYQLRNVIFAAQRRVNALRHSAGLFTVVIKPTAGSSYKNMVDTMDEMAITKTNRYALVDELTEAESKLLASRTDK